MEYAFRLAEEIPSLTQAKSGGSQIETFIGRRMRKFPVTKQEEENSTGSESNEESSSGREEPQEVVDKLCCELLALELLYLWNALPSCDTTQLAQILEGEPSFGAAWKLMPINPASDVEVLVNISTSCTTYP